MRRFEREGDGTAVHGLPDVAGRARSATAGRAGESGDDAGLADGSGAVASEAQAGEAPEPAASARGDGRAGAVGQLGPSVARGPGAGRPGAGGAARRRDVPDAARALRRTRHGRGEPASDHRVHRAPRPPAGGLRGPRRALLPADEGRRAHEVGHRARPRGSWASSWSWRARRRRRDESSGRSARRRTGWSRRCAWPGSRRSTGRTGSWKSAGSRSGTSASRSRPPTRATRIVRCRRGPISKRCSPRRRRASSGATGRCAGRTPSGRSPKRRRGRAACVPACGSSSGGACRASCASVAATGTSPPSRWAPSGLRRMPLLRPRLVRVRSLRHFYLGLT